MSSTNPATERHLSEAGQTRLSSFPCRQRRMGPAPLASFEDISVDKGNSDSSPEDRSILSQIGEEPDQNAGLSVPTSPRIRISAASSPSQHESDSKESTPDKELFTGYTKTEFCDEMSEFKDCTDELEPADSRGKRRKKDGPPDDPEKKEEALRISELIRKGSSSSVISDSLMPAVSGHSSRLSSLGSIGSPARRSPSPHRMLLETSFCGNKPIQNPSIDIEDPPVNVSNVSNVLALATDKLETAASPGEQQDGDINVYTSNNYDRKYATEDPRRAVPKRSDQTKSLQRRQAQQRRQIEHQEYYQRQADPDGRVIENEDQEHTKDTDKKNAPPKSPRLAKKVASPQVPVRRTEVKSATLEKPSKVSGSTRHSRKRSLSKKKGNDDEESTPSSARKSSFASIFKKSENALSPVTPDSPGGASGRKSPFSKFLSSAKKEFRSRSRSRSRSKDRDRDLDDDTHDRRKALSIFKPSKKKKDEEGTDHEQREMQISDPIMPNAEFHFGTNGGFQPGNYQDPQRLGHPAIYGDVVRISNRSPSKNGLSQETTNAKESFTTFKPLDKGTRSESSSKYSIADSNGDVTERAKSPSVIAVTEAASSNTLSISKEHIEDPDSVSISESERFSEIDELKRKFANTTGDPADFENKGLVGQDSFDDELPFVPTTLPQEKSTVTPILPTRDRPPKLKMTQSIDRPRSTTPIQPSLLEMYKQSSQELLETEAEKMTISLKVPPPGSIRVLPVKSPRRQSSKTWEDFCSEGLKSPRQLRQEFRESQQSTEDLDSIPNPPPPPPPPPPPCPDAEGNSKNSKPQGWINFDEIPDIVLKPVRQIQTTSKGKSSGVDSKHPLPPPKNIIDGQQRVIEEIKMRHAQRKAAEEAAAAAAAQPVHDESSEHSSDSDEKGHSSSSTEDIRSVKETVEELKEEEDPDSCENSDLERLLAPVNECITKLSSLSESALRDRRSPIPDNWEDFLLPPQPGRRSRLSSLGSDAGSLGRSPSPSHMLLETSFCGNQPIDDPGIAEPDIPVPIARKLSGISLGDLSPLTSRCERGSIYSGTYLLQPDRASVLSDSSAEAGSPKGCETDIHDSSHEKSLHPFGMDLNVKSNRSSIVSQDQSPPDTPYPTGGVS